VSTAFKRFLLWDYPRASWQYDVIVLLILGFIFLTPREIFRDQPRASSIVMLPSEAAGSEVFYLEPNLLTATEEKERFAQASGLLAKRDGKKLQLYRLTPIFDSEQNVKGYMAYTRAAR
jgi:hypothetical protein